MFAEGRGLKGWRGRGHPCSSRYEEGRTEWQRSRNQPSVAL